MPFQPNYRHMLAVLDNQRPARLPIYEHIISPVIMERILGVQFADLQNGDEADLLEFFTHYNRFFREMTYDTVSFEVCITTILPDGGAIMGGRPGPIQTRADFERYPWDELSAALLGAGGLAVFGPGPCHAPGHESIGRRGQRRPGDQRRPGRFPIPSLHDGR